MKLELHRDHSQSVSEILKKYKSFINIEQKLENKVIITNKNFLELLMTGPVIRNSRKWFPQRGGDSHFYTNYKSYGLLGLRLDKKITSSENISDLLRKGPIHISTKFE